MKDEFNTGGCNGCRFHTKDPEEKTWRYDDGSLRNDLCVHPEELRHNGGVPVPIFNVGCKRWHA